MDAIEEDAPMAREAFEKIVFFSGGVDACAAGLHNAGTRSVLVSVPSIESMAKNEGELRDEKYALIERFSEITASPWALVSNNFNDEVFNDESIQANLEKRLSSEAFRFDGWFGIKYLANMCSASPLAYFLGANNFVMGSTFEQLEDVPSVNYDGANPELSDAIHFAGMRFAEQDSLYTRRSEKVRDIISDCNRRGKRVKLWTCFGDSSVQCGKCPKCIRTELNILCAGENPRDWGFDKFDEKEFSRFVRNYRYFERNPCWLWDNIDAIDGGATYPVCNDMLHWLKDVGYKDYQKKAAARYKVRLNFMRILRVWRYPHYVSRIMRKIFQVKNA